MKNPEHILKKLKLLSLSPEDRTHMHDALAQYRAFAPARSAVRMPQRAFSFSFPLPLIASFLIMAFVGVGTAAAAEGSAPGDILYPVKTGIVEPARLALATNPEKKANVEVALAERRLYETERLAEREGLSGEAQRELSARFEAHTKKARVRLAEVKERNPERVTALKTKLEGKLETHQEALKIIRPVAKTRERAMMSAAATPESKTETDTHIRIDLGL